MRFNVRHTTLIGLGLAAALLSAGAANAGNLITNGDFESGALDGWDVSGAVLAVPENIYGFGSDNQVAQFGGGIGTGHEVLSQSFDTTVGQAYALSYDWAFLISVFNSLDVSVGGVTHSFCCSSSGAAFDYTHDTINFLGSGHDTVSFSVFDNPQDSTDTVVDNVAVVSVPEPASWAMMIAGFGLAGAALRRRRTLAAA